MMIESQWWKFKKDSTNNNFITVHGKIDFVKLTIRKKQSDGTVKKWKIQRTKYNNRRRPDADARHHYDGVGQKIEDKFGLFNNKDLEWLAWNWRIHYNMDLFETKSRMVFGHFNFNLGMLPTPE